jgi:hypothetical protein
LAVIGLCKVTFEGTNALPRSHTMHTLTRHADTTSARTHGCCFICFRFRARSYNIVARDSATSPVPDQVRKHCQADAHFCCLEAPPWSINPAT